MATTSKPTKADLDAAAKLLASAELSGLTDLQSAIDTFDAALEAIGAALPTSEYPSNVKRIAVELRNSLSHRKMHEVPNLINSLSSNLSVVNDAAPATVPQQ